jgi:hypothetical protein
MRRVIWHDQVPRLRGDPQHLELAKPPRRKRISTPTPNILSSAEMDKVENEMIAWLENKKGYVEKWELRPYFTFIREGILTSEDRIGVRKRMKTIDDRIYHDLVIKPQIEHEREYGKLRQSVNARIRVHEQDKADSAARQLYANRERNTTEISAYREAKSRLDANRAGNGTQSCHECGKIVI